MTQAFWDQQFKFSEVIPDFAACLERMARDSAAMAASHGFQRAAYGAHPRQWVEWTEGHGSDALLPVILHGGYWRALTAETHRFMAPAFLGCAAAVANVEYRLIPEVRLAAIVADTQAALHLLSQTFPRARLLPIGHSAGAHLALCALRDPALAHRCAGVIALSGLYDLLPITQSFLQSELHLSPHEVSTFTLLPSDDRPPTLFVNGTSETNEFQRAGALMASGGQSAWYLLKRAHHMSLPHAACAQADTLLSVLLDLRDPI